MAFNNNLVARDIEEWAPCGDGYSRAVRDSTGRWWLSAIDGAGLIVKTSPDGVNWTTSLSVPNAGFYGIAGLVVDSRGNVYVIYEGDDNWANFSLSRRVNGVWYVDGIIPECYIAGAGTYIPTMTIDGNDVIWLAWQDTVTHSPYNVFYLSKYDTVTNVWSPKVALTDTNKNADLASINAGPNGDIHFTFTQKGYGTYPTDEQVCYRYWNGATWSAIKNITDIEDSSFDVGVSLVCDTYGQPHVLAGNYWDEEILSIHAVDYVAGTWGSPTLISGVGIYGCNITIDAQNRLYAFWEDDDGFKTSEKSYGGSWTAPVLISAPTGYTFIGNTMPRRCWSVWPKLNGRSVNLRDNTYDLTFAAESPDGWDDLYLRTALNAPKKYVNAPNKVTLEAIRNIEMTAMGRFYIDESGNAKYEDRTVRNP